MNQIEIGNIFGEKNLSNRNKKEIFFIINNSICKIKTKNNAIITGYFCRIFFPDIYNYLSVLIINNYEFEENDIINDKKIEYIINSNEDSSKIIDESRKFYSNKDYNIINIEIKRNDKIYNNISLWIGDDINEIIINKEILEIYYDKKGYIKSSFGIIERIDDDYNIEFSIS